MRTLIENPKQFLDLKRECINRVEKAVRVINDKLGIALPIPQVLFSITGTVAGRAHIGKNLITFNPELLRINSDDFLKRTPAHEVAHLAAFYHFGSKIKAHGHEWAKCCWCLGIPAIRCHSYDLTDASANKKVAKERRDENGMISVTSTGRVIVFD